ncbi:hypothetical protein [Streptomyces noursei]|uniref:hypothetical protein n=1 Tax=Streptomyces noursei TaxID=1971 RepID=UPI0030F352AA
MTPGPASRTTRAAVFAAVCVPTTALGHSLMSEGAVPWWGLAAAVAGTFGAAWRLTGRERGALFVVGATVTAQLVLHFLLSLAQTLATGPSGGRWHGIAWLRHLVCGMSGHQGAWHGQRAADLLPRHAGPGMPLTHVSAPPPPHDGTSTAGPLPGMEAMPHDGMAHMGGAALPVDHQLDPMPIVHPGHGHLGMLLAHLLAAAVCGWWLWQGEAAAFRLAHALVAVVFAPLVLVLAVLRRTGPRAPSTTPATAFAPPLCCGALLQYTLSRRGPPTMPRWH